MLVPNASDRHSDSGFLEQGTARRHEHNLINTQHALLANRPTDKESQKRRAKAHRTRNLFYKSSEPGQGSWGDLAQIFQTNTGETGVQYKRLFQAKHAEAKRRGEYGEEPGRMYTI